MRNESCDLCVVGGGYTGLWTAIVAKERDPSRDVVLIDAAEVGSAASGRNGGFMESSLTHGIANGQERFPDEIELLEQLGLENLDAIENAIHRYAIDCDFERTGVIDVATTAHPPSYVDELRDDAVQLRRLGQDARWLDREAMRAEVESPTYVGGLWRIGRAALVDPARLAWGLKTAAEQLGVRIYEDTKATDLDRDGVGVLVRTPLADVRAARVALGTNAFKPLLRRVRHYIAPVYDYCMATEPLTDAQLSSVGWRNRQGLSDIPNQFHYYRLTEDNRIVWGGYDAVYYWRGRVSAELESRPETWATLSRHFFETFPQLEDVRFSHIWGGAIDTCSRFCVFWGTAMSGRVAYALGYTGLGVASTRFGAAVMLDLLDDRRSVATSTSFVKDKPLPFPPEPFRYLGIQATRWSLGREDRYRKAQPVAAHPRPARPRLRQLNASIRVFAPIGVLRLGMPPPRHSDGPKHSDGSASGQHLHVGDDEHGIVRVGPVAPRCGEVLQLRRRAQAVLERLAGEGRQANPVGPQPTPPRPLLGFGEGPRRTGDDEVLESGLANPRRQAAPSVGLRAVARRDEVVQLRPPLQRGTRWRPEEPAVVGLTDGEQTAGTQHAPQLCECADGIGQVLEDLVDVHDVEGFVLQIQVVGVADGELGATIGRGLGDDLG